MQHQPQAVTKREIQALTWQEDDYTEHGEGITRPLAKARTRQFHLLVFLQYGQPMRWTTQAETLRHAIRYGQARWPGAVIEKA